MLTAFTAGLLLISVSELGDKTFFIAVILAMRHSRRLVFIGVTAALAAMTILSVIFGRMVSLLPNDWIHYAEIALFLGFGIKLLYDASRMSAAANGKEVLEEAKEAVEEADSHLKQRSDWAILLEAFILTFMAEWGDRTQFATIALAASSKYPLGVTVGAILGHAICAAIAVIGGRLIAGRISERQITFIGGCLFLLFGIIAAVEGA